VKRIHFSLALPKWHEWLVYLSVAFLTLTGIGWLLLDRFGKVQGEFGPESNPALPWLLLAHGALAYAFLVIAAMLVPVHMRLGWNALRNRISGLTLVGIGVFLALTGLVLYYASAEGFRGLSSTLHWVIGLALPIALAIHVVRGKASAAAPKRRR
jgi:hypothetical protein